MTQNGYLLQVRSMFYKMGVLEALSLLLLARSHEKRIESCGERGSNEENRRAGCTPAAMDNNPNRSCEISAQLPSDT